MGRPIGFTLAWLLGCGPQAPDEHTGTADTGGSADDADIDTGPAMGPIPEWECVPQPIHGEDPIDPAAGCDAFIIDDAAQLPTINVRLVNDGAEAILVFNRTHGCHQPARHFDIEGEAGGRRLRAPASYCAGDYDSCQAWTRGPIPCQLCDSLHYPVYLAPGGSFEQSWPAWLLADAELPAACNVVSNVPQACSHEVAMRPGTYELSAAGARVSDCETPEACTCVPDQTGSCYAEVWDPPPVTVHASAPHDGICDRVELVFSG